MGLVFTVFLIWRGVSALKNRQVNLIRLLLLPTLFLLWMLSSVIMTLSLTRWLLAALLYFFLLGMLIGHKLCHNQDYYDQHQRQFILRGSPRSLCLMLMIFVIKFIFAAMLARQPELSLDVGFNLCLVVFSGLFAGFFWGENVGLLRQFWLANFIS